MPSDLALRPNVSQSLFSDANQDLGELNRTQELERRRERNSRCFGATQKLLSVFFC
jgi:hypothetical protein